MVAAEGREGARVTLIEEKKTCPFYSIVQTMREPQETEPKASLEFVTLNIYITFH